MEPLFLFAYQRSGTHYLKEILNNEFLSYSFGEVFLLPSECKQLPCENCCFDNFKISFIKNNPNLRLPTKDNIKIIFEEFILHLKSHVPTTYKYFTLDLKYNYIQNLDYENLDFNCQPYLFEIINENNWKIIHLIREDLLALACSHIIAQKFSHYHFHHNKAGAYPPTFIEEKDFISTIYKIRSSKNNFSNWIKHLPQDLILTLKYELIQTSELFLKNSKLSLEKFLDLNIINLKQSKYRKSIINLEKTVINLSSLKKIAEQYEINCPTQTTNTKKHLTKIAVVTNHFQGPFPESHKTKFYSALFEYLKNQNIELTLVSSIDKSLLTPRQNGWFWRAYLERFGHRIETPPSIEIDNKCPVFLMQSLTYAYHFYKRDFDWIHFDDSDGIGYCTLIAKNLLSPNTIITNSILSPISWSRRYQAPNEDTIYYQQMQDICYKYSDGFIYENEGLLKWVCELNKIKNPRNLLLPTKPLNTNITNKTLIKKIAVFGNELIIDLLISALKPLKQTFDIFFVSTPDYCFCRQEEFPTINYPSTNDAILAICNEGILPLISPTNSHAVSAIDAINDYPLVTFSSITTTCRTSKNKFISEWNKFSLQNCILSASDILQNYKVENEDIISRKQDNNLFIELKELFERDNFDSSEETLDQKISEKDFLEKIIFSGWLKNPKEHGAFSDIINMDYEIMPGAFDFIDNISSFVTGE